ncbi:MAG: DUF2332 domain-containing protein [Actinomycetota bacterium]|nr:DUF2332 domain-containing protein [Actinomycetota bacterium]
MAEETFETGGSPLYARLAREHADDRLLVEIADGHKPLWEVPLKVFAGVHFLALAGRARDPWSRFRDILAAEREWLREFVRRQPIQTNEVQRSWALLPAFLTVADERPLDLVELGSSAGLNLFWDRYRYRYAGVAWGSPEAPFELEGEATGGPPSSLFGRRPIVRARLGIDRAPVDVRDERQALLLESFVWADQAARLERLRGAIARARRERPPLLAGDYVELLPRVLANRAADALTVVYHSASTGYLRDDERRRLESAIEEAGEAGPLAWVSYEFLEEEEPGFERFALDVRTWPGGETRRLARVDGHANRMRWLPV